MTNVWKIKFYTFLFVRMIRHKICWQFCNFASPFCPAAPIKVWQIRSQQNHQNFCHSVIEIIYIISETETVILFKTFISFSHKIFNKKKEFYIDVFAHHWIMFLNSGMGRMVVVWLGFPLWPVWPGDPIRAAMPNDKYVRQQHCWRRREAGGIRKTNTDPSNVCGTITLSIGSTGTKRKKERKLDFMGEYTVNGTSQKQL